MPLLLALLLLPGSGGGPRATAEDEQTPAPSGVPGLSEAERSWLADHPVIRVAPDPDFPPFEFLDRAGRYQGMAADYVGLLEKKLGIRFEVQRLESWTAVLEKARAREVDLLPAAARTPQREEYLAFTAPHIRLPGVILTSTQTQGALSLDALAGRSVAVVNGYVWHDLLANDHPDIKLVPVPDTGTGLQMAAFQIVDAMVGDQATASHYIAAEGLINLRVAGRSGYTLELAMACRSDWPELRDILDKALGAIDERERAAIQQRWIQLGTRAWHADARWRLAIAVGIAVLLAAVAGFVLWNRALRRRVAELQSRSAGDAAAETVGRSDRRKILVWSLATMTLIAVVVASVADYLLYRTALHQREQSLVEMAAAQARLIEAVTRFDRVHSQDAIAGGAEAATLSQVIDAHERFTGLGESGEFLLGRLEEGHIIYPLARRHTGSHLPQRIAMAGSDLDEPMRRALSGEAGTLVGPDYRGVTVLAAYEPVADLGLGIVAKIDLSEIRGPFLRAALIALGVGALLIVAGGWFMVWVNNPLLKRVEDRERQFRTLVGNIPGVTYRCRLDASWTMLYISDAVEELTGHPPAAFVHNAVRTFESVIHEQDRADVADTIGRAVERDQPYTIEYRVHHRDQGTRWVREKGRGVRGATGEVAWLDGAIVDITDQKLAEQQLRLQSAALESAANAITITETSGQIIWVNQAFCDLTGFTRDEAIGANPRILKSGRHDATFYRGLWERIRAGRIWHGEIVNRRKDGSFYTEEMTITPMPGADGRVAHFIAIKQDVTARMVAQQQLREARKAAEEANEAKSAFLANMSHEIRTPMNGILGMTELALDTDLSPEQRDYVNTAHTSAEALLALLNDILDFSKIEAGRLELDPIDFQLRDALADTLDTLAARAQGKGLELTYDVPATVPDALVGDVHRLRQILVNLVGNAVKFTEAGEIAVSVELDGRDGEQVSLHFAVRDTGIGIPRDRVDAILSPFEQADTSTTRKYGGTGLGLAISVQLSELMGGRLWIESEQGRGSTFHFAVQMQIGTGPPAGAAAAQPEALEGLSVLVVDDNATNRRILEKLLDQWRMTPHVVVGGGEALAAVDRARSAGKPFRLVLSDVNMPGMDGFELFDQIKEHAGAEVLPMILLTSATRPGDIARCREMGVAAHLRKPVKQSLLLDAILNVVGRSPSADEPREPAAAPAPEAGRSLRVLLAEDNQINQKFAVRVLRKAGHETVITNNGREAVEAWSREPFDVVLMDVQMPEMDGLEATAAIRSAETSESDARHTPIIAMTANAMKGDREKCLAAGMDGYVSKPVRRETLFAEIERLLGAGPTPA